MNVIYDFVGVVVWSHLPHVDHHQNAKTRPRITAVRALPQFCQLTKLLYRSPLHLLPQWRWFYRLCVYLDFNFLQFFKEQKKSKIA